MLLISQALNKTYFSTEVYILVWRVGQINELKSKETMSAIKRCSEEK